MEHILRNSNAILHVMTNLSGRRIVRATDYLYYVDKMSSSIQNSKTQNDIRYPNLPLV